MPPRSIPKTQDWYEVRRSPIQGLGAFALKRIPKGTKIIEYVGEKISHEEADRRYDDSTMDRHHTFLFILNKKWCIDAVKDANEAKYINHSCDPNCETTNDGKRIWIEARKTIEPGTELAYDYRFDRTGDPDEEERYKCLCGSPKCRGTILVPEDKPKRSLRKGAAKKGSPTRATRKTGGAKKGGTKRSTAADRGSARRGGSKGGTSRTTASKRSTSRRKAATR